MQDYTNDDFDIFVFVLCYLVPTKYLLFPCSYKGLANLCSGNTLTVGVLKDKWCNLFRSKNPFLVEPGGEYDNVKIMHEREITGLWFNTVTRQVNN